MGGRAATRHPTDVRTLRYRTTGLRLDGRRIDAVGGDLIIVLRESDDLDWELVVQTRGEVDVEQRPYDLEIETPGETLHGPAIYVRHTGSTVVFRGIGDLAGLDRRDFDVPDATAG